MTPATPEQKSGFVDAMKSAMLEAAQVAYVLTQPNVGQLVIAHGAYESGWGRLPAAALGFNFWNLTAGPSWDGEVVQAPDTEYAAGSAVAHPITQHFRKYNSPVGGILDYLAFLSYPRYADAKAKLVKGDASFVVDLGTFNRLDNGSLVKAWPDSPPKGGFYTLPIQDYVAQFNSVLLDVQGLC